MNKLTLAQANQILAGAFAKAAAMGYKPMGVAVLDDAGHVKSAQRQDAAPVHERTTAIAPPSRHHFHRHIPLKPAATNDFRAMMSNTLVHQRFQRCAMAKTVNKPASPAAPASPPRSSHKSA